MIDQSHSWMSGFPRRMRGLIIIMVVGRLLLLLKKKKFRKLLNGLKGNGGRQVGDQGSGACQMKR